MAALSVVMSAVWMGVPMAAEWAGQMADTLVEKRVAWKAPCWAEQRAAEWETQRAEMKEMQLAGS